MCPQAHAAVDAGVVVAHVDGRAGAAHERGAALRRGDGRRVRRRGAAGRAVGRRRRLPALVSARGGGGMAWLIDQVLSIAYPQGKTFRSYCIGTGGYKPEIKHPLNRISILKL